MAKAPDLNLDGGITGARLTNRTCERATSSKETADKPTRWLVRRPKKDSTVKSFDIEAWTSYPRAECFSL